VDACYRGDNGYSRARRAADAVLTIACSGGRLHGGRQQECIGVARRRAAWGWGRRPDRRRIVVQRAIASSQPLARNRSWVVTSSPHGPLTGAAGSTELYSSARISAADWWARPLETSSTPPHRRTFSIEDLASRVRVSRSWATPVATHAACLHLCTQVSRGSKS
jgi:hypothetical protein